MKNLFGFIFFICVVQCAACKKNSGNKTQPPAIDTATLQGSASFKIGAAIDVNMLQTNTLYRTTLIAQHSSITIENAVKWPTVHPAINTFDFTGGDYIADFCASHNKRLHGHCLLWYQFNPDWLNNFSGDSLAWENLMKTHIQTVVNHYKGKATSWDVVNEAFRDDDGTLRVEDRYAGAEYDDGCMWARHLGRDYMARAFQYAHEADPGALLFYNEYGQEWSDAKTNAIISMVNDFKARGIPIHGIGLQMHIDINTSNAGIATAIEKLAATGLLIHISELDISVNPANDASLSYSSALQNTQAEKFAYMVEQYKKFVPPGQRYGITTWNVGDKDSWIRSFMMRRDWPLLFDDSYEKKSCYFSFRKALKN